MKLMPTHDLTWMLSPWLRNAVESRYNVITTGWLALDWVDNLNGLEERIRSSKKDQYDITDRYIIMHEEPDYYMPGGSCGLWMNRLLNIFISHDIPLWTLILIVDSPDQADKEIEMIVPKKLLETNQPTVLSKWSTIHYAKETEPADVDIDVDAIRKPMMVMMGRSRQSRAVLYRHIKDKGLFNSIAVSYAGKDKEGIFVDPNNPT